MRTRLKPEARRESLLDTALQLAENRGYTNITRDEIAAAAGVSAGLVTQYFGTMIQLRRAVMRAAVARENVRVVAQGLAHDDEQARKAPASLKNLAAARLTQ